MKKSVIFLCFLFICMFPMLAFGGIYTDSVMGLMWVQETAGPMTWKDALSYCNTLNSGGYTDWRLPDINELQTIIDYEKANPAINADLFPNTQSGAYWSSTTYDYSHSNAWYADFGSGYIGSNGKGNGYYVRPVRGGVKKVFSWSAAPITDTKTGLMWQSETQGPMTWDEAVAYCDQLNLGGYSDWHLPDIGELWSILNYNVSGPATDTMIFPHTKVGAYWTSSYSDSSSDSRLYIDFNNGTPGTTEKTDKFYVRAVRSATGVFTPVNDPSTGLMWQTVTYGHMTWKDALTFCENLNSGGYSDWRLPDINELQTIIDYEKANPAINADLFPNTQSGAYWSSTTYDYSRSSAWYADFGSGYIGSNGKGNGYYVRPVRGGVKKVFSWSAAPITDTKTGLMWQSETQGPMTWDEAVAYCDQLNLGGYSDWHLPDIGELWSILNYNVSGPATDTMIFPHTKVGAYWTSSSSDSSSDSRLYIDFNNGTPGTTGKTDKFYVRAVRSAPGVFTPVNDPSTGLMWQTVTYGHMTWKDALTFCENLNSGGYSDWRLPDINELQTIIDYEKANPAINADLFPNTQSGAYWSSTTYDYSHSNAWYADFGSGYIGSNGKGNGYYVRPVRGGVKKVFSWSAAPITDTKTGLMWQSETQGPMTWDEAVAYCDQLNLGGYSDWHLPDIGELWSILNYNVSGPATDTMIFPHTKVGAYWTSSYSDSSSDSRLYIDFNNGTPGTTEKTDKFYVRAVRSATGVFTPVNDPSTGLMWQTVTYGHMTWKDALTFCENLNSGGYSDWRLPDINELQTIIDYEKANPAINADLFPNTQSGAYWSSTTYDYSHSNAWYADFGSGYIGSNGKGNGYYVRPVRGGVKKVFSWSAAPITDTKTGLMWQSETQGPMTWDEAVAYCDQLNLGGYSDWHLPDIGELWSILNYNVSGPATDTMIFPHTKVGAYWTSSSSDSSSDSRLYIDFNNGTPGTTGKTDKFYVRAVRSAPGVFTPVNDPSTGLMWQTVTYGHMTWKDALTFCENLNSGGYSDWRLPDINELQTIIDYEKANPAINADLFPNTQSGAYWSSTTYDYSRSSAWYADFGSGYIGSNGKNNGYYVRPVRTGNGGTVQSLFLEAISGISGEAPFELEFFVRAKNIAVDYYLWDVDNDGLWEFMTFDNYLMTTFAKEGDYNIKVTAVDFDGNEYYAYIRIQVTPSGSVNENIRFIPYYPASDATSSEIMRGGIAIRWYKVQNGNNLPVTGKKLNYRYASGTELYTADIEDGFVKIETPYMFADSDLKIIVTDASGNPLSTDISGAPAFFVNVSDREFTEEYKLLIGMGGKFGLGGPGFTAGPVKAKTLEAGIGSEQNISSTLILKSKGNKTDLELENKMDLSLGIEGFAGVSASLFKDHFSKNGRPEVKAGLGAGGSVGSAMFSSHRFENFTDNNRPDHNDQLLASASLFFENLIKSNPVISNNILVSLIMDRIVAKLTGTDRYFKSLGGSFILKGNASLGAELTVKNPIGSGSGLNIEAKAFDGEYVYEQRGETEAGNIIRNEQTVTASLDVGVFKAELSKKFGGGKDTPKLAPNLIDYAYSREEGSESIAVERSPEGDKLVFTHLINRTGGNSYFLFCELTENYLKLETDDPHAVNSISDNSDLVRGMITGEDSFTLSPSAYKTAFSAFTGIDYGEVRWEETAKDVEIISVPIEIGGALGLKLDLSFKADMEKSLEYTVQKGLISGAKGMFETEKYEKDGGISNNLKGWQSVVNEYVEVIDKLVNEVVETYENVVEAGKELVVSTKNAIVEGGAAIKAGASALASNVKLKITQGIGSLFERSYRIRAVSGAGELTASTVGNVFIVSAQDGTGKLITQFTTPLELVIGYTETALTAAGYTSADVPKLKIYKWDSAIGYYTYIGGSVDAVNKSVTASITLPGQYVLAIDQTAPQPANFKVSDGTPTPTMTFSVSDNLSGINPNTLNIKIDDSEIVNKDNYASYLNLTTGVFEWKVQNPLVKGNHTVTVTIGDTAGNTQTYTYNFTVNNIPPAITHTPVTQAASTADMPVKATVTDDESVKGVFLYYRAKTGEMPYQIVQMINIAGTSEYTGNIPKSYLTSFGARYYLKAIDNAGNETVTVPADITVQDTTGPEIFGSITATPVTDGIKLSWKHAEDADTVGYKVWIGKSADTLQLWQDMGNTNWILLDVSHRNDIAAVSAYDSTGIEGTKIGMIRVNPCSLGDIDCNGKTELKDAILALQILSGMLPAQTISILGDVNNDQKIGLEEAIYIFQNVATALF